ncbi:MAG: ABC transporter permease, partial [Clostridia bacterium]
MTWWTAIKLSFQNLLTKKGRTVMTSIAGSIGIIGVALVLAISNGMNAYILSMQKEVLANYPVEVSRLSIDTNQVMQIMMGGSTIEKPNKFPPGSTINPYDPMQDISQMIFANTITQDYVDYVARLTDKGKVDSINYSYGIDMPVISEINRSYFSNSTSIYSKVSKPVSSMPNPMGAMGNGGEKKPDIGWQQMSGGKDYVLSQYDLLAGEFPTDKNQVVLVIDKSNQLSKSMLASMGLQYNSKLDFADIIGNGADKKPVTFRLPTNNAYYQFDETAKAYKTRTGGEIFNDDSSAILELQVVGILRQNPDAKVGSLGTGVAYTQELTHFMLADSAKSDIVQAQLTDPYFSSRSVLTGEYFPSIADGGFTNNKTSVIELLGGTNMPNIISIYPKDFDSKEYITNYLNSWNTEKLGATEIKYSDMSKFATDMISETIKIVSIALICFAAVSLLVSSVMIGIITYVSVVERTKEIGILRSLGARKRDITNVFNAETSIIGFASGLIGVLLTYLASIPINLIIGLKTGISTLCALNPLHALMLVAI